MRWNDAKGLLRQFSERLNYMMVISLGLLISNVFLALFSGYAWVHQKRIIIPYNSTTGVMVSDTEVDARYLDLMSVNLLATHFNVSPETVQANNVRLLSYISTSAYAKFLEQLNNEAKVIQHEKMSSVFYINKMVSNPQTLTTVVSGTLNQWVGYQALGAQKNGERALPATDKIYQLQYAYTLGRLTLTSLTDISHENHTA